MTDASEAIKKITDADSNTFVIFFVNECPYCQRALALLRDKGVAYKGYNIHDIKGDMPKLLEVLGENSEEIGFSKTHRTKPIIFYNRKLIGGYDKLVEYFKNIPAN